MEVLLASKKEAHQIAKIHKQEINQGFLSSLGVNFLKVFYQAIVSSPYSFIIVAQENDKIIGFVAGCTNIKKFYGYFLKKYFWVASSILLSKIFKFSNLKKIIEVLLYPHKESKNNIPDTELLSIAVIQEFHGQQIALKMFEKFVEEIKNKKINVFKVVVGEKLKRAIGFYEKMGFKFHSIINVHKNEPSRVYIYEIK